MKNMEEVISIPQHIPAQFVSVQSQDAIGGFIRFDSEFWSGKRIL
jgi:hypothetical protein